MQLNGKALSWHVVDPALNFSTTKKQKGPIQKQNLNIILFSIHNIYGVPIIKIHVCASFKLEKEKTDHVLVTVLLLERDIMTKATLIKEIIELGLCLQFYGVTP